ncbi:MAG: DHH family phosphoesterase [Anaerolineales bacterium]|nr:DHH family phosphoesterase [Anaerolineales bacterium]
MKSGEKTAAERQNGATANELPIASLLAQHRGERHAIVLQNFPDPDAISAAYAHRLLSAAFDIETDILYAGRISHLQNIALVRLLDLSLIRFEGELPAAYDAAVFVDNQGTTCQKIAAALEAAGVPPLIVVDHHEKQDRLQPEFCDIRPVGATATIYAEYLAEGPLEMREAKKEHVLAATALMHGLMTDTNGFVEAQPADFEAAVFLSQLVDKTLLSQIMSQARSKQVMETIHKALGNRLLVESFSLAGIGYLRAEDRDAIPEAVDFLLTEGNVHTAIVYGIVVSDDQEEVLVGSLRTTRITVNPDEFIKDVFGQDAHGRYYGGGKVAAGGFEIPVGFLAGNHDDGYEELKWRVFDSQVKARIFSKIGVTYGRK